MRMYDSIDNFYDMEDRSNFFSPLFIFLQVLGLVCVVLTGFWAGNFWGGFDWYDKSKIFNYHPFFMVIGMIFIYADTILFFRIFRNQSKRIVKVAHAVLHITALIFAVIGTVAVFEFHNRSAIPNMYSVHSWIGISVIVLYFGQWLISFLVFFWPGGSDLIRTKVMHFHRFFGLIIFIGSLVACLTGLTEKNFFSGKYKNLEGPEVLGNIIGIFILLFGGLTIYLVNTDDYKRVSKSPSQQPIVNSN